MNTKHGLRAFMLMTVALLTGCDSSQQVAKAETQASGWPRTFDTPKGKLTIKAPPQRIVSTSVTLTGTLLTINAPLIGTGTGPVNMDISDDQGFFSQWAAVAKQRKVQALYHREPSAEAIATANPDLIIVSATGGDSALRLYDQLSQIAPTIVVNYDDKSWQDIAVQLGAITGHEQDANQAISDFAAKLLATKQKLRLPPQPTTAMVYYEDNSGANVWTANSGQGRLLLDLGFTLAKVPDSVKGNTSMGLRKDIIQLSGEKFSEGLQGQTMLLFTADDTIVQKIKSNKFLAQNPAIAANRVYAMGIDTFRIDYYSASNMLKRIEQHFQ
ncbi:MAG: Fe2+-enterobactin ABC transporter substrate-binding protein [Proteobacteria bacterium]|nr:Fe2+-enterobactin ABC transporter substrate-binding protein [Pseudomonadota bacterium]